MQLSERKPEVRVDANETFSERLSALDAAFLAAEGQGAHMHIASLALYGDCELCGPERSVDIDTLRERMLAVVEHEPRLRQRIVFAPGFGHPYWVDDAHFLLDYHVRHTALPRPGDRAQLKRLMGRVLSQPLSRDRPLWELWVAEGLEEGGYALILKLHHAMLDGMASAALLERMILAEPGSGALPKPRKAPSAAQLLRSESAHRAHALLRGSDPPPAARKTDGANHHEAFRGARDIASSLLTRTLRTALNPHHLSGQRNFDVMDVPLTEIRRIKQEYAATVNDVVLATVAGGLRRFMLRAGVSQETLNAPFRALVPAATRGQSEKHELGNQVGMMVADLPLHEADPRAQLRRVHEGQQHRKQDTHQVAGSRFFVALDDRFGLGLLGKSFKLVGAFRPFNVIVTNVPGPPMPVKVFGAPLRALYGAVPLIGRVGLGIALFSYNGTLCWGVQSDLEAVEDLNALMEDFRAAHQALLKACGVS